jgi:hypothetical protein
LLGMSLSPCRRFHPAKVTSRIGQCSAGHSAFALQLWAQPSDLHFRGHNAFTFVTAQRLVFVTAQRLVTSPREILSIGFEGSVSITTAIRTTGL